MGSSLTCEKGRCPLGIAIRNRDVETTRYLVELGANVSFCEPCFLPEDYFGFHDTSQLKTPMLFIAIFGDAFAKVSHDMMRSNFSFSYVPSSEAFEIIELLLRCGANPNVNLITESSMTLLSMAFRLNDKRAAKLLLKYGATPEEDMLEKAIRTNDVELIELCDTEELYREFLQIIS